METDLRLTDDQLVEPRLASLYNVYVDSSEVSEILRAEIERSPDINTDEYAKALVSLINVGHAAGRALLEIMRLDRCGQVKGYKLICDAVAQCETSRILPD